MLPNILQTLRNFCILALLLSSLVIPVSALAFYQEGPASVQSQQSSDLQKKQPAYQPGLLILKFRDEAFVGAVAEELVKGGQPFRDITGDGRLDRLNRRHKVKSMRSVFGKKTLHTHATGSINRTAAVSRHRLERERFKADVDKLREQRLQKKRLSKNERMQRDIPYLGSIYKVEVDAGTDIERACSEYLLDPQVAYCQPDYRMETQWLPNDPLYASFSSWGQGYEDLWGLKKLQTAAAWDLTRGDGVVVAVIDSGVDYNHVDLAANIWNNSTEIPGNGIDDDGNGFVDDVRGWDFYNNDNDPMDGHGHGTHTAGTIAAVGDNGIGIIGVAPAARIMPLKGLSDAGSGSSSGLAAAINYAADNGADVINNSWGCSSPCASNPVAEDAVAYAHGLGGVVVFSAGNSYSDVTLYSPQNQSNKVITVAASSELDTRSYFSNIGSLIDVAAPGGDLDGSSSNKAGRNILSLRAGATDLYGDGLCIVDTGYYRARGTSMAAPHVSGVAALVLAAHPSFTPDEVSLVLRATADDIESPGFDLLSGAGRVNAQRAVGVSAVPTVRITAPLAPVSLSKVGMVTISGDAYGTGFTGYRLYYAPLQKVSGQPHYTPTVGAWEPLGQASSQSVINGTLATISKDLFQSGWTYLVKLEVTTAGNGQFSDVKEVLFYSDDSRFYILTTADLDSSHGPQSEGDRFAWIENDPGGGPNRRLGKVYDGATNRLYTIAPEPDKAGAWIDKIFLNAGKIVWYETNYSYGQTGVASLSSAGEFIVEHKLPYELWSTDRSKLLLNEGRSPFYGSLVYLFDVTTGSLSQEYPLPAGDPSQFWPSLYGDTVVTNMWYPGGVNDDVTVNLTDLPTGTNEIVKVLPGDWAANGIVNAPGVVVWHEDNNVENSLALLYFDKSTKEIKTVSDSSHPYSFASDGSTILFSAFGNETGVTKLNLYAYDVPTGVTSFYSSNNVSGANNNMWPSFGTKHVQWWANPLIIVSNTSPTLNSIGNQAIPLNAAYNLPVTAIDPEQDTIELAVVGGLWPNAPLPLPVGAAFTDHGNGTGALQWTPSAAGMVTISFLARDFSGRKDEIWNSVRTATYLVHDPADPMKPLGIALAGSGTVSSSPGPDISCTSAACSRTYTTGTMVTLTAVPAAGFVFSGWSGACSGTAACTVTMDQPRMVTAAFSPAYQLSTIITGGGRVNSSPAPDINCISGTCSNTYNSTTVVTLTATPEAGYLFSGWSGACSGTDSCLIMMNQSRTVTATFIPTYLLDVTIVGSGTVQSSPAPDINCTSGTCSRAYSSGSTVTLNALPAAGFAFSGWSGACSGTGSCTVTMDQARSVTATFATVSTLLSVSLPIGGGTVHSTPDPDINCSSGTCSQWRDMDSIVNLSAVPGIYSYFGFWGGACTGTNSCSLTMSQARSVTAVFYACFSITATNCFSGISDALSGAPDGSVIKIRNGFLQQSQNFNRSAFLSLEGGYDATFTSLTGITTVPQLIITKGSLTVSGIAIK